MPALRATVLNSKLTGFPWTQIPTAVLFQPLGCSSASLALHAESTGLRERTLPFLLSPHLRLAWALSRRSESGGGRKGSPGSTVSITSYLSMVRFLGTKALASLSLATLQMLKISGGGQER